MKQIQKVDTDNAGFLRALCVHASKERTKVVSGSAEDRFLLGVLNCAAPFTSHRAAKALRRADERNKKMQGNGK